MMRLGLEDAEFWSDPWRTRKAVQREMMRDKRGAFLMDAPEEVALNEHTTLPIAVLRVRNLAEPAVDFRGSAVVAAMNLDTGELSAGRAFRSGPPPRAKGGGSGMVAEGHSVDLAARLKIPLTRGTYQVTLLCLDRASESRRMRLVESDGYDDPEVHAFLASKLTTPVQSPRSGDPVPTYLKHADSPPIPNEPGIGIVAPRVTAIGPATECVLAGSFRLPLLPHYRVEGGEATAVVPITLLLTGSVTTGPHLIRIGAPSYSPVDENATGYFALDLCRMADLTTTPQTWFLYAFGGAVMEGPAKVAFARVP